MADLDKLYEMTVESNTNIKHILREQKEHKVITTEHGSRLVKLEGRGRKTVSEHLLSFGKVCGAFVIIGAGLTGLVKVIGKLWQ